MKILSTLSFFFSFISSSFFCSSFCSRDESLVKGNEGERLSAGALRSRPAPLLLCS